MCNSIMQLSVKAYIIIVLFLDRNMLLDIAFWQPLLFMLNPSLPQFQLYAWQILFATF